jgi:hypothetical protein
VTLRYPRIIHIDVGGPSLAIVIDGRRYLFEDHRYCGPMPVDAKGNGRDLGPRHRFWTVITWWYQQGKEFNADGTCKWVTGKTDAEELAEQGLEYVHVAGKHWALRRIGTTSNLERIADRLKEKP